MARPAALIAPRAVVDFETRSELPIKGKDGVGAWRYAEHHSTEIICLGYRLPGEDVKVWTPDQRFPQELIDFYTNGGTLEAHNAQFERAIWYHVLLKRRRIPMPSRWVDTLASCAYRSLPLALDKVGEVVNLPTKKDKRGSYLLDQLSKPRRPLKADKKRFEAEGLTPDQWPVLWRTKEEFPELYQETYDYCAQDVRTEEALSEMIGDLPDPEYRIWVLDQVINQRGVQIDLEAVHAAQWVVGTVVKELEAELQAITGGAVQTGKQVAAMRDWLESKELFIPDLKATTVEDFLNLSWVQGDPRRVLEIRSQLSNSSSAKLPKFLATVNDDGRIRGTIQYYGAGTGRFSGRGIQPQNFPRGLEDLDMDVLIEAIKNRDIDCLTLLAGDPMEAIASSLRGMIIAAPGKILRVADFSAIEAVVLAWLAGEEWKLEAFAAIARKEKYKGYDDIYCATASKVLGRFVSKKTDKTGRQVGKTAELSFGYVGGVGAWKNFDRSDTYNDEQIDHFKKSWREEHPEIVKLWWALDDAAVKAIRHKGQTFSYRNLAFRCISDKAGQWLQMILPNGRILWYFNPQIEMIDKWGNGKLSAQVTYEGRDNKRGGAWGTCRGYAGIWTENAVQAIARDLMVEAMVRVEAAGYPIVLTVHDELVCEVDEDHGSQEEFLDLMVNPIPPWAEGCPVSAAGEAMYRYRK